MNRISVFHTPRFCILFACTALLLFHGCNLGGLPTVPKELEQYFESEPLLTFSIRPSSPGFYVNTTKERALIANGQDAVLSKLASLGHVKQLIVGTRGTDIDKIAKLNALESLHLSCDVDGTVNTLDLSPIAELKQLKEFSVYYTSGLRFEDAKLACPSDLIRLSICGLSVRSIGGLDKLKNLNYLDVSFNSKLEDVSSFATLPKLKFLKLSESTLTLLTKNNIQLTAETLEVVECVSLQKTKISANDVTLFGSQALKNLAGLENWQGVKRLTLHYLVALEDISTLQKIGGLEAITITDCKLNGQPITVQDLASVKTALPSCTIIVK